MLRSLIHFRSLHAAVILGAAVCAAIVTGALVVGDSVRASLADLALDRLGRVEWAVLSDRFLGEEAAGRLGAPAVPAILLQASVAHAGSGARAGQAAMVAIDLRFDALFPDHPPVWPSLSRREGQPLTPCVINRALAAETGAQPGDTVRVTIPRQALAPADSVMGRRELEHASETLRAVVTDVLPASGPGRFALTAEQAARPSLFLPLADVQRALGQNGRANAILVPRGAVSEGEDAAAAAADGLDLADRGLTLTVHPTHVTIESLEFVLPPTAAAALEELAVAVGGRVQRVRTTVAVSMRVASRPGVGVPYSTITAIDPDPGLPGLALRPGSFAPQSPGPEPRGGFPSERAPRLAQDEIVLSEWAAQDLGAAAGDMIDVETFVFDDIGVLRTRWDTFRMAGVVMPKDLGADRTLTPIYPGIQDARDMAGWDPPFPVDLSRVRERDEAYWDLHGATPKAFVSEAAGAALWGGRHGSITSLRVATPGRMQPAAFARTLAAAIRTRVPLPASGIQTRPVRAEALAAARGSTDFGALFSALSFFLITSGALLAGLLFRLGVERRAREIGLLRAVGYPVGSVRKRFLAEGAALSGAGLVLGLPLGVGYAALLMLGLRGAWRGAVGTSALALHARPGSLALGALLAFITVMVAIALSLRRLVAVDPSSLLAGSVSRGETPGGGSRLARATVRGGLAVCAALVLWMVVRGETASASLALPAGAAAMAAAVAAFALWCRSSRRRRTLRPARGAMAAMAARNLAWNPGRSVLSVALVASACFLLASVAASRGHADKPGRDGGTGGYALVARTSIPLHADLGSAEGREALGIAGLDEAALRDAVILSLRDVPGDDVSCLNLYTPQRPRLVGVSPAMAERGGFRFARTIREVENPWTLLDETMPPGVIPAIGDINSVQWILHLGLGDDLVVRDETGNTVSLRFVALLAGSLFQSEILIAEKDLLARFPGRGGRSFFLIETPSGKETSASETLEKALDREGFDAEPAASRIARYREVEQTYLSTFQVLGGLGLLLGTCGLGVVMARNLLERRGELAALRALGFRRAGLVRMVLAETAILVSLGAACGSVAALAALAPRVAGGGSEVAWGSLLLTLAAVIVTGVAASVAAAAAILRAPLMPALRSD